MTENRELHRPLFEKIKDLSWWTFYTLFLLTVLYLLSLIIGPLFGGALGRVSNFGEFIYFIGLIIAILGLMGLCVAYIVRVMWHRFKANQGGQIRKL